MFCKVMIIYKRCLNIILYSLTVKKNIFTLRVINKDSSLISIQMPLSQILSVNNMKDVLTHVSKPSINHLKATFLVFSYKFVLIWFKRILELFQYTRSYGENNNKTQSYTYSSAYKMLLIDSQRNMYINSNLQIF